MRKPLAPAVGPSGRLSTAPPHPTTLDPPPQPDAPRSSPAIYITLLRRPRTANPNPVATMEKLLERNAARGGRRRWWRNLPRRRPSTTAHQSWGREEESCRGRTGRDGRRRGRGLVRSVSLAAAEQSRGLPRLYYLLYRRVRGVCLYIKGGIRRSGAGDGNGTCRGTCGPDGGGT